MRDISAFERLDRTKRAKIEVTTAMAAQARQGYQALQNSLSATSSEIATAMNGLANAVR